jgi:hypothetical protein
MFGRVMPVFWIIPFGGGIDGNDAGDGGKVDCESMCIEGGCDDRAV